MRTSIAYIHVHVAGRALCLECRVSWVRVPPEVHVAHLGCAVLLCLVVEFPQKILGKIIRSTVIRVHVHVIIPYILMFSRHV